MDEKFAKTREISLFTQYLEDESAEKLSILIIKCLGDSIIVQVADHSSFRDLLSQASTYEISSVAVCAFSPRRFAGRTSQGLERKLKLCKIDSKMENFSQRFNAARG